MQDHDAHEVIPSVRDRPRADGLTLALLTMHESIVKSSHLENVFRAGMPAPPFALPECYGLELRSEDLLRAGPLVVFFT